MPLSRFIGEPGGARQAFDQDGHQPDEQRQPAPQRGDVHDLHRAGDDQDQDRRKAGQAPVIDEQLHDFGERGLEPVHLTTRNAPRRSGRSQRTAPTETTMNSTRMPSSDRSPPGQSAPSPSPDQNTPNDVSISPTTNFSMFSGIFDSGRCTTSPTTRITSTAAAAPRLA